MRSGLPHPAALVAGAAALCLLAAALLVTGTTNPPATTAAGGCHLVGMNSGTSSVKALSLDAEQLTNAAIVVGVAESLGVPDRGIVIGLATALQESGLRSLTQAESDRDSAGIFQQRPSMGWGSTAQVMDPVYAAKTFFQHLAAVPDWRHLPLTVAAQAVQRSAYPNAYAQWAQPAAHLASALHGHAARIDCTLIAEPASQTSPDGDWPPEKMGPDGLTPRTRKVRDLIHTGFGETHLGGWCPGGCSSGHITGSDHYTGHAIDIMIQPSTNPTRIASGTRLADWLVANARTLAVKYVIYRARIWTPAQGWHPYTHPSGSTNPTLLHMDHVHVSVY